MTSKSEKSTNTSKPNGKDVVENQVVAQERPRLKPLDLTAPDAEIVSALSARVYGSPKSGFNRQVRALIQGIVPVFVVADDFSPSVKTAWFRELLELRNIQSILSGKNAKMTHLTANRVNSLRRYVAGLNGYNPASPFNELTENHHDIIVKRLLSILARSLPGEKVGSREVAPKRDQRRNVPKKARRTFEKKEVAGTPKSFAIRPPRVIERIGKHDIIKVEGAPQAGSKLPTVSYRLVDRHTGVVEMDNVPTLKAVREKANPELSKS